MTEVPRGARAWLQGGRDGGGEGGGRAGECSSHEGRRGEIPRRGGGAIGGLGAGVRTEPRGGKIRVWRSLLLARARVHGSSPPPCNSLPGRARKARSILLRLLAGVRGGAHRASAGAASRHHRRQASSASARADQSWVDQIHREEQDETSDPATAGRRGRGTSRGRHQAQVRRSARRGAISRLLPSRSRGRARTDRCVCDELGLLSRLRSERGG